MGCPNPFRFAGRAEIFGPAFWKLYAGGLQLEYTSLSSAAGWALFQFLISSLQPLVLSSTSLLLTIGNSSTMLNAVVRSP